jgi:hypothetical protein
MEGFIQRHKDVVIGVLNGFDRIRFRGTRRLLSCVRGMGHYLSQVNVMMKDFKDHVASITERIRQATDAFAEAARRPVRYLSSPGIRKEEVARQIAQEDGIREGLICVLRCVEPCMTYRVGRDDQTRQIELRQHYGKCLHYYHYWMHPQLGFMHARLQTWFPFTIHVCINGREWLARQMDGQGIGYVRRENCFAEVSDVPAAQRLLDAQLRTDWTALLNPLVPQVNPADADMLGSCPVPYYWSTDQTEWASDVMFQSPRELAALYPSLIRHGITCLGSQDVLRFLGRKVAVGRFRGEVTTDLKCRPEGIRIKHQVNRNSIKMYDKQGSVLRVETTINDARDLRTYRRPEGQDDAAKRWLPMRKGVADLHRRAEVSHGANERYLEAMAPVDPAKPLSELAGPLCQPAKLKGKRVRALNPLANEDASLLQAVVRGEFCINGFRNRDLRALICVTAGTAQETRRQSAAISRKLRMLRGHGLIRKTPGTHRYTVTAKGQAAIPALLLARKADINKLQQAA